MKNNYLAKENLWPHVSPTYKVRIMLTDWIQFAAKIHTHTHTHTHIYIYAHTHAHGNRLVRIMCVNICYVEF